MKAEIGTMACCFADRACSEVIVVASWVEVIAASAAWESETPMLIVSAKAVTATFSRFARVVLLITDFLHSGYVLAICFGASDSKVGHCSCRLSTMPMLDAGRAPTLHHPLGFPVQIFPIPVLVQHRISLPNAPRPSLHGKSAIDGQCLASHESRTRAA